MATHSNTKNSSISRRDPIGLVGIARGPGFKTRSIPFLHQKLTWSTLRKIRKKPTQKTDLSSWRSPHVKQEAQTTVANFNATSNSRREGLCSFRGTNFFNIMHPLAILKELQLTQNLILMEYLGSSLVEELGQVFHAFGRRSSAAASAWISNGSGFSDPKTQLGTDKGVV